MEPGGAQRNSDGPVTFYDSTQQLQREHTKLERSREVEAEGRFICDKVEIYSSATHNQVEMLLYISAAESVACLTNCCSSWGSPLDRLMITNGPNCWICLPVHRHSNSMVREDTKRQQWTGGYREIH